MENSVLINVAQLLQKEKNITTITKDGVTSLYTVSGFTDTFTVHIDVQDIASQTAYMLIDLSDTTNWAHTLTGHIILEYIILEIDPASTHVGETRIGFLSDVDASNGDFNQIIDIDMKKKSDLLVELINFGSHGMDLETTKHFGPVTANSALFQTSGANILGPDGTTTHPSGAGDLVMIVESATAQVDVSITLGYETAD